MSLPGSNTFTYEYDLAGRLTYLNSPLSSTAAHWTYQNNGWINHSYLPNGAHADYTYNANGTLDFHPSRASPGGMEALEGSKRPACTAA